MVSSKASNKGLNVTRAVLRQQRAGQMSAISSTIGLAGFEFNSAYAAKFGLEGFMQSLRPEIAPFNIAAIVVNPLRRPHPIVAPRPG